MSSSTTKQVFEAQKKVSEAARARTEKRFVEAYGEPTGKKKADTLMSLLRKNLSDQ